MDAEVGETTGIP